MFLRDTQTIHDFIINNGVSFSVEDASTPGRAGRQTLRATGSEENIKTLVKVIEERRKVTLGTTAAEQDADSAANSSHHHHFGIDTQLSAAGGVAEIRFRCHGHSHRHSERLRCELA